MKFSESWLRQHVGVDADSDALERRLTMIGLEVEGSERIGASLDGVVVARIVSAEKHPEADRLQVCEVDAGNGELLQIVCGAPNARAGLVAPLAKVGAKFGDFSIMAAKLRGVESSGMLCSAKELGIDADASGLFELPDDAPVGTPIAEYLGLPDNVIELGLTPNRADCFCVRGIAYDVAAACGGTVSAFDATVVPAQTDAALEIGLDAGADAPLYCGRVIEGVDAGAKTPVWMAQRLQRSGVRPVSLLVDITQYVMLELGQPMHAYDRDLLQGPIGVRKARDGETLKLLNGDEAKLDPQFLVIVDASGADKSRAIGLTGIMGGDDTKVGAGTKNVFLEAAHFAPSAIIGRGRRLGLHTDASHRFERGVDPQLPKIAIEYATRLVLELAGGTPGPVTVAELPECLPKPQAIALRRARIARVLGVDIAAVDVERILRALGMSVEATGEGWNVTAPSRRFDIAIEEDLIEELARIHGYERIPTTLPGAAARIAAPSETALDAASIRRQLVAREMLETINFAFVDVQWLRSWGLEASAVPLANPLSAELAVMRTSLLPGLVAALQRNLARQAGRVRLFEIGNVFKSEEPGSEPVETLRIAAAVCGDARAEQWGERPPRNVDFHDLKGDLESLAAASGAALEFRPSTAAFGHPGRSADVYRDNSRIGWIGQLHPRLSRALDLDADVLAFELDLQPLAVRALPRAVAPSRFPSVRRDLAFTVAEDVNWAAISATIATAAGPLLRDLLPFDRYVGPGVESGCKSLAAGLILQDNSRTLTDQDVEAVVARVVAAIDSAHGARIRG
ncbi:MAG: phenylalanine--tRNA ligase subunit beta [Pseudoxanthomonas sp.]